MLARVFRTTKLKRPRAVRRTGPNQSGGLAIASARMRLGDRGAGTSTKYCACLRTEFALLRPELPPQPRCARPLPWRPEPAAAFYRGRSMLNSTTTASPHSPPTPSHVPAHSPWTPERIEQLRNCVSSGLSCSQIAAEIGVTRNAVIGKIHRLGLGPGRPAAVPSRSCPPRARQPRSSPQRHFLRLALAQSPSLAGDDAAPQEAIELDATLLAHRIGARQMPLADRRSVRGGFFLLRQRSGRGLLLLRRSCPHGLSGADAAARLAERDADPR